MTQLSAEINVAKKGMDRDSHPSTLGVTSYSFALNANYEDSDGGAGTPMLQNEPSNFKWAEFPEGYKVIGYKKDSLSNRTYFFLSDGLNSEIGYVDSNKYSEVSEDSNLICDDCSDKQRLELAEGLEGDYTPRSTEGYITLISDACVECDEDKHVGTLLNFSIDHPIQEGNIVIKEEKCGKTIYWTDNFNPPRYLKLDMLSSYQYRPNPDPTCGAPYQSICDSSDFADQLTCTNCGEEETNYVGCIDSDALRLFPLYSKPCINPVDIQSGGQLKPGVYEFMVAYSDKQGNETSEYFAITNPITIFEEDNKTIGLEGGWNRTNLGIRLIVNNLSTKFLYYKVAFIQRAAIDGVTSYFIEGVHPIYDNSITLYTEQDKLTTTLQHLLVVKSNYIRTEMLASNNGYLFHGGLTVEKEMNLQKVVNLMGAFLRWKTVVTTEDLYNAGVNTSKYEGFLRDEVYPFSIRFLTDDNFTSANFFLSNRPKLLTDISELGLKSDVTIADFENNSDIQSIISFAPECSTNNRNQKWQFYNTAHSVNSLPVSVDTLNNCTPEPYSYGTFGYFESTETYPDNKDLFDSSDLIVKKSYFTNLTGSPDGIIHESFEKKFFAAMFTNEGQNPGNSSYYVLNDNANFVCDGETTQGLRLYRFPDFNISPFMGDNTDIGDTEGSTHEFGKATIYPIGVMLDPRIINIFLDVAVDNNLITPEQRKRITKYEIFRGDRALNKSIIAKGLLYDMYEYQEEGLGGEEYRVLYPNYPYNDLGEDDLNRSSKSSEVRIKHPYKSDANGRFTFHSPDTSFFRPTLPNELKIEAIQSGFSRGVFVRVKEHSKWVILTERAHTLATTAASVEAIALLVIKAGEFISKITFLNVAGFLGTAPSLYAYAADLIPSFNRNRKQWIDIFKDSGKPYNFASYYTSEGWYNRAYRFESTESNLRGLTAAKYINGSRYRVHEGKSANSVRINNQRRESSVYLSTISPTNTLHCIDYPQDFVGLDDSRFVLGDTNISIEKDSMQSPEVKKTIASLYASIKNYVPNQYGELSSIKWLPMSNCGSLSRIDNKDSYLPIFGGDTFITRFSLKRKMPLFLEDAVNIADRLPFDYLGVRNIGYPRFYVNYEVTEGYDGNTLFNTGATPYDMPTLGRVLGWGANSIFKLLVLPIEKSLYNLDRMKLNPTVKEKKLMLYLTSPATFYLYYYGIPQFLVESEINLNTRYGKIDPKQNFYPNVGDFIDWTQETTVPISTDNYYFYNNVFSKSTTPVFTHMLPDTFNKKLYDCLYDSPNGVAYSMQDNSEQDLTDPWIIYKPLDFYQFKTSSGKLIDLKGIESTQILARFENQMTLFNAIDYLKDRVTPASAELGTGGIFATRPIEFSLTDLGYAGTQHKAMISNEFGHFWVDAIRGQVFQMNPNGQGLQEITTGLRHWFKEHLPFKIMRGGIKNLTATDLDNQFKGLGIVLGWDSLHKRLFLTKRDYTLNPNTEELEYKNGKIIIAGDEQEVPIELSDTDYFTDVSFTLAYSMLTKTWISYYSFAPDFYINHHNFFQTGLNPKIIPGRELDEKAGLWNHLSHNNSFQVFYGERYPFTIDMNYGGKYADRKLQAINYWLDTQRKHNDYDFSEHRRVGFNKAWIYNNSQNSGELNLVPAERNNMKQRLEYPKTQNGVSYILATEEGKKWNFNYFFNRVKNELNNIPIWNYDTNQINKTINPRSLNYNQKWLDRISGDWFNLRLTQDAESRYKFIFKFANTVEK